MQQIISYVMALVLLVISPSSTVAPKDIDKNIVAYFPNWATYSPQYKNFSVGDIPWDKVTIINHAFFKINDDFQLESTDKFVDFEKEFEHSGFWRFDNLKGHFGEYKYYKRRYPDVKVIISIGGWSESDMFHKMALTAENRKKFIDSCIEFLKRYPFIDGLDIDWEYPGVNRDGVAGGPQDKENFTKLLKEVRGAYDSHGMEDKMLTIAIPAGEDKIIGRQEPDKYHQYLDFINLMSYDMHGAWENVTNHHSPIYKSPENWLGKYSQSLNLDDVVKFYIERYNIPAEKLIVGAPFYSRGWKNVDDKNNGLYTMASGGAPSILGNGGENPYWKMKELENVRGYIKYRDKYSRVPYLYNREMSYFYTYEDEISLSERADYVNTNNLGGIVIWEITGDDFEGTLINTIYEKFSSKEVGRKNSIGDFPLTKSLRNQYKE
jgi:chitinase